MNEGLNRLLFTLCGIGVVLPWLQRWRICCLILLIEMLKVKTIFVCLYYHQMYHSIEIALEHWNSTKHWNIPQWTTIFWL